MLRIYFISLAILTPLVYFIPRMHLVMAPVLVWQYQYDMQNRQATDWQAVQPDQKVEGQPFTALERFQDKQHFADGPAFTAPLSLAEGELVFVPFRGSGIFKYAKIGKQIDFISPTGEIYWSREAFSYPVSDPVGERILLLTGDNSRVDLIDRNGRTLAAGFVAGNFLTDYDFSTQGNQTALL
ncbi:MAG: hypothetical protein KDK39_19185, partial [Leptospiraceae bacterium]|nr:hypothetical protein [Leptospiraceae bacterium]